MIDDIRLALATFLVVILPVVITFWLVIHLGAGFWKERRLMAAYSVAGLAVATAGSAAFAFRSTLLGRDLGTNWWLAAAGVAVYAFSFVLWMPVRRHLSFRTFLGIPEVASERVPLLQSGPFALVRHPRYLMVIVGVLGWCLFCNFAGVYLVSALSVFGLIAIVQLEERELLARYGTEYAAYQARVPQIVPNRGSIRAFLATRP